MSTGAGGAPARTTLDFAAVQVGDELTPLEVDVTATVVVAGAVATRDFMPVHHDRDYANAQGAPDIFMNILSDTAYCSRFLTDWAGPDATVRRLAIRLGVPMMPGSMLRYTGAVTGCERRGDEGIVTIAFRAVNDLGDHLTGTAELGLPGTPAGLQGARVGLPSAGSPVPLTDAGGAATVIELLDLAPHPEGGHYRQTWADEAGTAIYFLLAAGERSAWHRVHDRTELWHFYAGDPLRLDIDQEGPGTPDSQAVVLGAELAAGQRPQAVVPAGAWQSARTLGAWTLVGCTVTPPFSFDAFELAPVDAAPEPGAPPGAAYTGGEGSGGS